MAYQRLSPDLKVDPINLNVFSVDDFLPEGCTHVMHGFVGRNGGVSTDIYEGLNCGFGAKTDSEENVGQNRQYVAKYFGVEYESLTTVYQEHGRTCVRVVNQIPLDERPKADAMITDVPGVALGILTADCAPVLFYGEKDDGKPVVAAAHAGWRGAIGGVLSETVMAFETHYGISADKVRACIGPCIQKKSYEVSRSFYEGFLEQSSHNEKFFMDGSRPDHYQFDLSGYCAARISHAGVKHVSIKNLDTYSSEDSFFSCRRAAHKGESDYGRQISVIKINSV